jgi:hypothetical protein
VQRRRAFSVTDRARAAEGGDRDRFAPAGQVSAIAWVLSSL